MYEEVSPKRHMDMAVIAGVNITKYFTSLLSAMSPKKGLKRDGIFLAISKKEAYDKEIPSLSISKGKMGAKKEENIS
jgi:hypothetical protein